ncbi:testican-1-like [Paramacrobiotus metropolitanus]|uniref:testican-1-like n=1 Tax=Paramacrobiotus metropolitanus TaxID=2943436 RepID=UPI00244570DA|nr:testican-1-like [Paramacrobiotus metropolitanus]XP_055343763.1 testican-1-like [Paramacrobiotus metropolitanus]
MACLKLILSLALVFCLLDHIVCEEKKCLERADITVAGSNNKIQGWKNVGGCTCTEARNLVNKPGRIGGYVPQCDEHGKFHRRQGWGGVGSEWCVDEHGHQISETNFRGSHPNLNC